MDYDQGMTTRRRVLGDAHVDRAVEATTEVDEAFQEWITKAVWGGVWSRPGLDRKVRSLVTIALLAGLGHEELRLHLEAAPRMDVTPEEVAEVLLHVAVYAGVPAANSAFKLVKETYGDGDD